MGIPLHYNQKLVISLSEPMTALRNGDFFFQAGVRTPGTISLKYCYLDQLKPCMMKDEFLHRLLDELLYAELCEEADLPENIFLRLVTSGKHGCSLVSISELYTLATPKLQVYFNYLY